MLFTFYQINFILSYVHPKYIENGNKNSTKKNKLQAKQTEILHRTSIILNHTTSHCIFPRWVYGVSAKD